MAFRLIVPAEVYRKMLAQAEAERPNECCGLLSGVLEEGIGRVVTIHPLVNALASPVEYRSDDRSMFLAVRDLTSKGLDVLAVYHSHPTSPPLPSKKDLASNYSEDVVNLIVSLLTQPPVVRGWWLTATDYHEADWQVLDGTSSPPPQMDLSPR